MTLALIEPVAIPDTFVSGLSHIEPLGGGNLRFVCYVSRDGCNWVAARIILPTSALPEAIAKAMAVLTGETIRKVTDFLPTRH